jgi:predicted ABC-type ATPase
VSKIINVRGCNGSGKTYTVTGLLPTDRQLDHRWGIDTYTVQSQHWTATLLGRYETACGGMDTVKTQIAARSAVEHAADISCPNHSVVFEGVLISTIYGPWEALTRRLEEQGHEVIWAFMDTPLDVCLQRIYERNGGKAIKEDLVAAKHRTISNVRRKAEQAGITVVDIDHTSPRAQLRGMLYHGH